MSLLVTIHRKHFLLILQMVIAMTEWNLEWLGGIQLISHIMLQLCD